MGNWQDFEDALQAQFLERREVIHGRLVALVARQHVLLIGPPGAAKSELARTVCGAVGGRFFRTTLTPTSTPDELLGPVSAKRLIEDDVIARNLDGSLATADVAAVDEVWKCNAANHKERTVRQVADGARFCAVPVIDVARQRQMVAEATLAHVRGEVDSLVREVDGILTEQSQGRKVRESTAERYLGELRRLGEMVEEYRGATRDWMAEAAGALDLLRVQVTTLLSTAVA